MRIAIAALLFDDTTRIGSHRARALSAQLAKLGNEVTVFTQDFADPPQAPDEVEVVRLGRFSEDLWPRTGPLGLFRKSLMAVIIAPTTIPVVILARKRARGNATQDEENRLWELNEARLASVRRMDQLLSTHVWLRRAGERLQQLSKEPQFDIVFSTFEALGRQMRDMGVAAKWVDDFRDPAYAPVFLPAMRAYLRRYQDRLLIDADWSTAISTGVKRSLTRSRIGRKKSAEITVITNGFTPRAVPPPPLPSDPAPLRIGYTGALYSARIGIFREFLKTIRAIDPDGTTIQLHYAGREGALVNKLAQSEQAGHLVHDHGLLSHPSALSLQEQMDVLMVASWNSEEEEGVLSGKFLEYLGADRPILALVAGTKPGSELRELIEEMNVGICVEEAGGSPEMQRLRDWLVAAAAQRAGGKPISFSPNQEVVNRFSYPNIALQLNKLLYRLSQAKMTVPAET